MSNIGKKPIELKEGVSVEIINDKVKVAGPKGVLETKIPRGITVEVKDGKVKVQKSNALREYDKYFGLARSLIANMVEGVITGFEKKLELSGVGYRAQVAESELVLNIGYSVPIKLRLPEGITLEVSENIITVRGADKQLVGEFASKIRKIKPPDPYKGKGIKYLGEIIRRKAGKAAKTLGAAKA